MRIRGSFFKCAPPKLLVLLFWFAFYQGGGAEPIERVSRELNWSDSVFSRQFGRGSWAGLDIADVRVVPNKDIPESLGVRFDAPINLENSRFLHDADFRFSEFRYDADFRGAEFDGRATFRAAIFDSDASFYGAKFASYASFRYVRSQAKLDFAWAVLPDTLDLRYLRPSGLIDLSYCRPPESGEKCLLAIFGTDPSKIKLRMDDFQLWFPQDTVITTVRRELNESTSRIVLPKHEDVTSLYQLLLSKFKEEGLSSSYEILDKDFSKYKASHGGITDWALDWFQRTWSDYGYNKVYIFRNTVIILIVLTFWPIKYYTRLSVDVYNIRFLGISPSGKGLKRVMLHIIRATLYTSIVFFSLKIDLHRVRREAFREHPFLFSWLLVTYVAGLFCLGYIANYIFTL